MLAPARDPAENDAAPGEWETVVGRTRLEVAEDPCVVLAAALPAWFAPLARAVAASASATQIVLATGLGTRGLTFDPAAGDARRIVAVARSIVSLDASATREVPVGTRLIVAEGVLERGAAEWIVREVAKGRSAADLQALVPFKLFADASLAPMREG